MFWAITEGQCWTVSSAKESHVFGWDFLILLVVPPQHKREVFVGQETLGCNVPIDILHHLQKLLLSAVSFPAAFRARCTSFLWQVPACPLLKAGFHNMTECRCMLVVTHLLRDLLSGASCTEGWRLRYASAERCLSKCECPILVLLEEQFPPRLELLYWEDAERSYISLIPPQDFWLCILLLCLILHYSNLGL